MRTRPPLLQLKATIVRQDMEFRAFAAAMNWRPDYLSHVLAGRKPMPHGSWERAALVLGVDVGEIEPDLGKAEAAA